MVEFGEEMIIDSFRIPWLIWIQVIVFLLLLFLLYSFSLLSSSSDPSPDYPLCSSSSSSSKNHQLQFQQHQQVGEITGANIRSSRRGNNSREGRTRAAGTNDNEVGSSVLVKERSLSLQSFYDNSIHPCNIVRLAKIAFLKCLGLDSTSPSNVPKHRDHRNQR